MHLSLLIQWDVFKYQHKNNPTRVNFCYIYFSKIKKNSIVILIFPDNSNASGFTGAIRLVLFVCLFVCLFSLFSSQMLDICSPVGILEPTMKQLSSWSAASWWPRRSAVVHSWAPSPAHGSEVVTLALPVSLSRARPSPPLSGCGPGLQPAARWRNIECSEEPRRPRSSWSRWSNGPRSFLCSWSAQYPEFGQ